MRNSFKRILTLTNRNVKEIIREPLSLVFTIVMPLFMEILFYLIFHNLTAQFAMKYLAPSIVVFSQSFLALFVGILLATDRSTAFLTRLYVSKARPYEFILGYTLSIIPIVFVQEILFFAVGAIFDASVLGAGMLIAILLGLVTSVFFIAVGLLLGGICNEKSIGGVASAVIAGQSVLSGMWFPIDGLGDGIIKTMNVLPFRNATMLVQNAISGIENTFWDFLFPLLVVLAYTLAVGIISVVVFKKKMKEV